MSKRKIDPHDAENLKTYLADCGPEGKGTLLIMWTNGRPTSTGRTDYYEVRVLTIGDDRRPEMTSWLNRLIPACDVIGRFNKAHEMLAVFGCGYSKSHAIADALAHFAGHPIRVQGVSARWVKP